VIMHLSVALDGAGWHPAAWREPRARPGELLSARYWTDIIAEAEHGLLDFVTIEDALSLQSSRPGEPDGHTGRVRGRLDAVLVAARVAPLTSHIGLMPTIIVTHTEPFHISKAIATLDYVSTGRAGVRVRVSASPAEAAHFGRRDAASLSHGRLFAEASDYVEVIRRMTPRSEMLRPAGSSTGTSCTTSTSSATTSASRGRRSHRDRRRGSRR
jgi:alkanesulfonate monooxygenase SsuD/methylene tetrahydromethanopterin reductase-like flavin-dependent oxidoreductase (luciferase family)